MAKEKAVKPSVRGFLGSLRYRKQIVFQGQKKILTVEGQVQTAGQSHEPLVSQQATLAAISINILSQQWYNSPRECES